MLLSFNRENSVNSNSELKLRGRLPGAIALLVLLSSCSALQSPSGPQASAPSNARAQAVNRTQTTEVIPELATGGLSEQQALIDAINRDGQRLNAPGFNEPVPTAAAPRGDNTVSLNYEQADLRLVLEELAAALDISLVIDPSISNVVSVRTAQARPLTREDVWPLMQLLSRDAGVVLERAGNVYNARRQQTNLPAAITTPDTTALNSAARMTQVTPLTYISPAAAMEALAPLLEPDGSVRRLTNNTTLAITGAESQLERANQLLTLIDADPFVNQGIRLYPLNNASAAEVAEELTEILLLIEGPSPAYQVKGIERINALLITAPATRGFDEILRWVRILDADSQDQVEQLFHYQVKNLNAVELAETLSDVFEIDNDERDRLNAVNNQARADAADNSAATAIAPVNNQNGNSAAFTAVPAIATPSAGSASSAASSAVSANLVVKIVADESTNSLLIRSTARDYRQLLTTINQLDVVPLQVMINAVIAQITLTEATKFGVDWSRVAANSSLDPISTSTSTSFLPAADLGGVLFSKTFIDGAAQIDATLEAISTNNEVRLLARPSLTVTNNQEGEIQIGSQVPVQQGESIGTGGFATTNIQYRDTGIVLTITPQINKDGVVNLVIRQELSSVDSSAPGVNNNPVFNNQEINTTVVVRNGENVVLGGLIQTDNEDLNTGVPGLTNIPVLGRLFSYRQNNQERRELFIVLRPEIINLNEESTLRYGDILERFELASDLIGDEAF
jgi:general secretion pathway protein D